MTCFGLVVLCLGFPASVAEFAYIKLPCATSHGSGALFWAMMFSPGGSKGGKGLGKDPSSPTQMEMGNVPITPSTPSTVTRQGQGMVPGQQGVSGIGVEGVGNGFQVPMGNGFGMMPQVPLIPGGGPSRFQPQNPGLSGPQGGMAVGGLTPQMQNVQQVLCLAQGLSNQQLMSLIQGLQEQVQFQGRMNPSNFGQVPFGIPVDLGAQPNSGVSLGLDGGSGFDGSGPKFQDVFSKSEKLSKTYAMPPCGISVIT